MTNHTYSEYGLSTRLPHPPEGNFRKSRSHDQFYKCFNIFCRDLLFIDGYYYYKQLLCKRWYYLRYMWKENKLKHIERDRK
jgi:hypothetical protein